LQKNHPFWRFSPLFYKGAAISAKSGNCRAFVKKARKIPPKIFGGAKNGPFLAKIWPKMAQNPATMASLPKMAHFWRIFAIFAKIHHANFRPTTAEFLSTVKVEKAPENGELWPLSPTRENRKLKK